VTPSPAPISGGVSVSPSSVSFLAAGPNVPAQIVVIAQSGNTGGFTLSTTDCGGIVSVTPAVGAGPFSFSPSVAGLAGNAGTCSYVVSGSGGATATIRVSVTTTSIVTR
jgi:hypothetical protein